MKTFRYVPVPELPKLEVQEKEGRRFYVLPSGAMVPSITTVLGHFKKQRIVEWKKKVGWEKSNLISQKAASFGTKYHNLIEKYLDNKPNVTEGIMPDLLSSFQKVLPTLDRIDNIRYMECPLYSEEIGIAGRCDLIAEFDGILSIIDHKTSAKEKREEWIQDYFEQKTGYALMLEERTGIKVDQIVTIIVSHDLPVPQIFIREKNHYKESLLEKVAQYKKEFNL